MAGRPNLSMKPTCLPRCQATAFGCRRILLAVASGLIRQATYLRRYGARDGSCWVFLGPPGVGASAGRLPACGWQGQRGGGGAGGPVLP
jgi:hypothetical protein